MAIEVEDVVAQFGAYYIDQGQNIAQLRTKMYQPSETAAYFQNRPTINTEWRSTLSQMNSVLQPFQKAWTPKGDLAFEPNSGQLFHIKIDNDETPDDLESSYLGFLDNIEDNDRANWPFVKWFIEVHIIPKSQEDYELYESFLGVFAAPTPGTAGATGTSMNGIRKVIRTYNTAGRTGLDNGPIATGALATDPSDFVRQVEAWADAIPYLFRNKMDFVFMSDSNATLYKRGKRILYGKDYNFINGAPSNLDTVEDYPNLTIARLQSMGTSNMIWGSPTINRIRPLKKSSLANTIRIESIKRTVSMFTDWWEALDFEVPEFIFHNDQDLS